MPTPQFNVRVPEQYHDLLRLIVDRLRANPDGADALAAALSAVCRQSTGTVAISADSLSAAAADSLPSSAVNDRLDAIEARVAALEMSENSTSSGGSLGSEAADLLLAIQQRQMQQEETTRKVMAFAQTINDRVIEALGQPAETKAVTQQHDAVTQPPRLEAPRNRPIPVEHLEEAARLWNGGDGSSIAKIIAAKGWSYHRASLDKAVKRYLKQSSGQVELPASHVDENPAPQED